MSDQGRIMTTHVSVAPPLLVALVVSLSMMQPPAGPSGHWEGTIQAPGQEVKIEIDLAPRGEEWQGTISNPSQGLKGLPLSAIAVQGDSVSFAVGGMPGSPQFKA